MGRLALWLLAVSAAWGSNCDRTSVGFPPFTQPFAPAYKGQQVSLYPNGSTRPAAYESAGLARAILVLPRDAAGNPDANGKIVLLSVGMSNTTMEFSAFVALAKNDARKDPHVLPVDGAVGGRTAASIVSQPDTYWSVVDQRLLAAGATASQVQVIWLKEADANPTAPFPDHAITLESELRTIVQQAQARFPYLSIVYFSSRIYAGYASSTLNPEPYAYEGAFAVKWLIEERINLLPSASPVAFPWLAWGPYLWADGLNPRGDGLTWACADLQASDGTHPSTSGQQKVAAMLLDFFHSDSTARTWYLAPQANATPVVGAVVNSAGWASIVANSSLASIFGINLAGGVASATGLPLTHELAGTRVEVDGTPTLLYYVSPYQINFVLPAGGQYLAVVSGQTSSAPMTLPMQFWAPGLYTLDYLPNGPAAALHSDGTLVSATNPAHVGETIMALGTGLGLVNPLLLIAIPAPIMQVGGIAVDAKADLGGASPGVTQVRFTVPAIAAAGTTPAAVPLVFQLGTYSSNAATLAVVK